MKSKILVAGVGNIFLGDDAFGVEVAQRLAQLQLPEGVSVIDFGIRSYDLAFALMSDWDLAILVDALPRGGKPGTLYVMEPELPGHERPQEIPDAHSMNPVAVLQLVYALGGRVRRLLVVGCEPGVLEPTSNGNIGLSAPVEGALDEAVRLVEGLISRATDYAIAA
jgi:hydrogenase maturation protease